MSQTCNDFGPADRIALTFVKASVCAMLFGGLLGGCTPQAAGAAERAEQSAPISKMAAASHSGVAPLTVKELVKLAGQPCDTALEGSRCMSDESDFELIPDCSARGYYAVVKSGNRAPMLSKVPPQNNVIRSTISSSQLVCVQAIARIKNYRSYAFVTAVSSADPTSCPSCADFGSREITWSIPHKDGSCEEIAPGRFEGGCAIGWVDGDSLEFLGNAR